MNETDAALTLEVSRRRLLGVLGGVGVLGGAGALGGAALTGCSSAKHRSPVTRRPATSTSPSTTAPARKVRIGYAAEITGPNSARGQLVKAAFDAMTGYVTNQLGGTYHGQSVELVPADAGRTAADGQQAYRDLISQSVDAILWCSPFGLVENLPAVTNGSVPLISVMTDIHTYVDNGSVPLTGGGARGGLLFQTALPDAFALDVLLAYASEDRDFATVGLLVDRASYPNLDDQFTTTAARRGLFSSVFTYDSSSGHIDLSGPLQTLKKRGVHVVMVYGLADQASTVAAHLQTLDATYVDTPTAKRMFKPMLMGSRWGTGDPNYARLAGDAAARATITAGSLGSVITQHDFPMRTWLHDFVPDYNGRFPQGGEDGPADAAALVLQAVAAAGSTKGSEVVAALENGNVTTFASSIGLSFAVDRHLALSRDDAVLLSLEFPPTPYDLGNEWREVLPKGYTGPTQLIDFTLAANARARPEAVAAQLARRYGTSAGDDYQGGDRAKVHACKAVH